MPLLYGVATAAMLTLLASVASVAMAFNTVQNAASASRLTQAKIADIGRESEVRQARFERYAQEGLGVTLQGYYCDPATPPAFDPAPWAREKNFYVYDANSVRVGYIRPDGTYRHYGYCAN